MAESQTSSSGARIDHLVYATPALEETVADVGARLGVEASFGGRHEGRGTRNFLLSLGEGRYLELIGADPDQWDFAGKRSFGLDTFDAPRLVAWAVRVQGIDVFVADLKTQVYDAGPVRAMHRLTPDGQRLDWRLTDLPGAGPPFLLPFLIDWGSTPHPSDTSPAGAVLRELRLETSRPEPVQVALSVIGIDVPVVGMSIDRLVATIEGPGGSAVLG